MQKPVDNKYQFGEQTEHVAPKLAVQFEQPVEPAIKKEKFIQSQDGVKLIHGTHELVVERVAGLAIYVPGGQGGRLPMQFPLAVKNIP